MKICRFETANGAQWGVVGTDGVHRVHGDPFNDVEVEELVGDLESVRLLAPCEPSKVVCVGRNYRSLLQEQGRSIPEEPFIFLKASTAVTGPNGDVLYPEGVGDVAHEGELAVVIGSVASQLDEEAASSVIVGYTCANDITVRDWQGPADQWWRAKSCDSHCPLGPWIETDMPDPENVRIRTLVDGEVRQDGTTSDLVFGIPRLLSYISNHMTLLPGDVVLTGTAAGIRPVKPGNVMEVEVEGIGTLRNAVREWPSSVRSEVHNVQ